MKVIDYSNITIDEIKDLVMVQFLSEEVEGTKSDIYRLLVKVVESVFEKIKITDNRLKIKCTSDDNCKTRDIDITCYNNKKSYYICPLDFIVECKKISSASGFCNAKFKVKSMQFVERYGYKEIKNLTIKELIDKKINKTHEVYEENLNELIDKENLDKLREKFNNILDKMSKKEELQFNDSYDIENFFNKYQNALNQYKKYIME